MRVFPSASASSFRSGFVSHRCREYLPTYALSSSILPTILPAEEKNDISSCAWRISYRIVKLTMNTVGKKDKLTDAMRLTDHDGRAPDGKVEPEPP